MGHANELSQTRGQERLERELSRAEIPRAIYFSHDADIGGVGARKCATAVLFMAGGDLVRAARVPTMLCKARA
jgi:hypothetical protein